MNAGALSISTHATCTCCGVTPAGISVSTLTVPYCGVPSGISAQKRKFAPSRAALSITSLSCSTRRSFAVMPRNDCMMRAVSPKPIARKTIFPSGDGLPFASSGWIFDAAAMPCAKWSAAMTLLPFSYNPP